MQVVGGDVRGAFERYVGKGFRHHNPHFPGDAQSLRAAMEEDELQHPGKQLDVLVAIQEGNYVAVHSRLRRGPAEPEFALVHVFRFEEEHIVEAWDVAQAAPENIVNEHGMF
jgi:predicted SnoaL-like aldol condensation-catalyzing enzyme